MINLKILKKNKKHKYLLLKEDAINHKNIKKFRVISKNKKKNTFDIYLIINSFNYFYNFTSQNKETKECKKNNT